MPAVNIYQADKNLPEAKIKQVAKMLTWTFKHKSIISYIFDFSKDTTRDILCELTRLRTKEILYTEQTLVLAEYEDEIIGVAVLKKSGKSQPLQKIKVYFPSIFQLIIPLFKTINFRRVVRINQLLNNVQKPATKYYTLEAIGVREDFQGKGIGKKLLTKVEEISDVSKDSNGVYLFTVKPVNRDIYKYIGYNVISIKKSAEISIYHMFKPACEA